MVETLTDARAAWNAMTPWLSEAHLPVRGERQAWLAGVATNLKPGDALLFVGDEFFASISSDAWDFRLITAVEADAANDRTRVAWARGLGASDPFSNPPAQPGVFAMRKRSAVFGNNAPVWRSMDPRFRSGYAAKFGGSSTAGEWAELHHHAEYPERHGRVGRS